MNGYKIVSESLKQKYNLPLNRWWKEINQLPQPDVDTNIESPVKLGSIDDIGIFI